MLGADSTSSVPCGTGMHYFDFTQKVFEIGEGSTLALITWGLGGLGPVSYRTILARLGDDLAANKPISVAEVAQRFTDMFWAEYCAFDLTQRVIALSAKGPYDPAANPQNPVARTKLEEDEFTNLRTSLVVGFCIAGYLLPSRTPEAASITFDPLAPKPVPTLNKMEGSQWWGVPNIISRLIFGADANLKQAILSSGKWNGTQADLEDVVQQQQFSHATLPIRDAIDYVYSCIHCTIKAMKFSSMAQVCGGPIEIAVITTDRKFRWVRHKPWDAAITDGEYND
ncbi:hypothetical protein SAMN04515617_105156 [Collimonas sp. OK242]|nr:hypothetical protein SAMN04515617_105156 [Collimonas sp. OK242]